MIQFLTNIIEWVALAGLTLLGVDYDAEVPCPSELSRYTTVEYVAAKPVSTEIAFGPDHDDAVSLDCVSQHNPLWVPVSADEVVLLNT